MKVIKKDGTLQAFNPQKIINAASKSARRVMVDLTEAQCDQIVAKTVSYLRERGLQEIPVADMHNAVEMALEELDPQIAKSYKDYRNYKKDFVHLMDEVYQRSQEIRFLGDKENSNSDSALVATKRCLIFNELNKRLYRRFFMTKDELQACKDGYIYIHDQSARLDTMNCFRQDTRFITDRGVKSFYDFSDGDKIRVLSHKGVWRNATVRAYGWQKLQKVTFKRGSSRQKVVYVTANHRWLLKDGTETTSLKVGDKLIRTPDITLFDFDALSREDKKIQVYSNCGNSTWFVTKIEPATPNSQAQVWCLEVEEDHSFLLEGGIPTGNCCLCDMETIMSGGFEMGNVWYNEPKTLDTAFDVMGDIILATAAQQYGGFTVPEVDKLLAPYALKSYRKYIAEYCGITGASPESEEASEWAEKKVERDFEQGFQGIEMKLNTVGSSRGDYPFIAMTFGLATDKFGKMASKVFLRVHMNGQGKPGNKKPVLFPKLIFLYDEKLHGVGCVNEDVFEAGIECSCKTMYPKELGLSVATC